ncbi:caspase family protein [Frankia sp. CiP3]|uniref:caspase family protein n=1 Tax=Frankia sp. CiP3 TaxID=2880971 RepID=UPI001EF50DA1|nr:caspase family protein [Frankia sp. CiP3]
MKRDSGDGRDGGAGTYRALLVGVPSYEDTSIDDLPFVEEDLRELMAALEPVGYQVEVHDVRRTNRDAIESAIESFIDRASRKQTLVLYLSGHGVHGNGQDYLVPSSAFTRSGKFFDKCVPIDFRGYIDASNAGDVVILVDACREGVHLQEKATMGAAGWSRRRVQRVKERRIFYVYACGPGERARFTRGSDAFSVFSRALSIAMADEHGPATLAEFRATVQNKIDALTTEHKLPSQRVHVLSESDPAECILVARPVAPVNAATCSTTADNGVTEAASRSPAAALTNMINEDDPEQAVTVVPDDAADELPALVGILETLESDLRRGSRLALDAMDRFTRPEGLLALADPEFLTDSGRGLRPWLADLQAAVRAGRRKDAAIGIAAWRRHAAQAAQATERLINANAAPRDRYEQLRSRLRVYTAKAGRLGLLEDAVLSILHAKARATLDEVPTDLRLAERCILDYADALSIRVESEAHQEPGMSSDRPAPPGRGGAVR